MTTLAHQLNAALADVRDLQTRFLAFIATPDDDSDVPAWTVAAEHAFDSAHSTNARVRAVNDLRSRQGRTVSPSCRMKLAAIHHAYAELCDAAEAVLRLDDEAPDPGGQKNL